MVEKAYQRINSFLTTAKKLAGSLVLLSVFLNCETARAISLISDEETEIFLHQTLRPVFNAAGVAFRPGQIYIVNDRELNAFVTDGNRMFVNIGTITAADSQNELTGVLGLLYNRKKDEVPAEVTELVEKRAAAKKAKDWATADAIRAQLTELGWAVKDTAQGPQLSKL